MEIPDSRGCPAQGSCLASRSAGAHSRDHPSQNRDQPPAASCRVGAPQHQVGGVPPVTGLGHVGLVAEDLRGGDRQVGVPVVERQHRRADQRVEPGARGMADHAHRRDRAEPRDPVRTPGADRVDVRGRGELHRLVPARPDEAALAAGGLVAAREAGVAGDLGPGLDRVAVMAGLGLPEQLQQHAPHVGIADPGRRVGVPGERRAARAPARLVVRPVRPGRRVIGLLGLPRDDPVLDVHLPRARARAVHPVRRADDLVIAPPVPVEAVRFPAARLLQRPHVSRDHAPAQITPGPH